MEVAACVVSCQGILGILQALSSTTADLRTIIETSARPGKELLTLIRQLEAVRDLLNQILEQHIPDDSREEATSYAARPSRNHELQSALADVSLLVDDIGVLLVGIEKESGTIHPSHSGGKTRSLIPPSISLVKVKIKNLMTSISLVANLLALVDSDHGHHHTEQQESRHSIPKEFETVLQASRVYQITKGDISDVSLRGSGECSAEWSRRLSGLSLGDISTYPVINAPILQPFEGTLPPGTSSADTEQPILYQDAKRTRGRILVTYEVEVKYEDAPVPRTEDVYEAHISATESLVDVPGHPEQEDGPALTVPDSGYGTASKIATSAACRPTAQADTNFDDVASVITDNLSLGLPQDVGNTYVREFVEQILGAVRGFSTREEQRAQLIQMLPDVLRAFALRVSFTETNAEGHAVGIFTRKNRGRITDALQKMLQPPQPDEEIEDNESAISEFPNTFGGPAMTVDEKIQGWFVADSNIPPDPTDTEEKGVKAEGYILGLDASLEYEPERKAGPDETNRGSETSNEQEADAEAILISELDTARINFVVNTTSFSWLLKVLRSRSQLDYRAATARESIRKTVSSTLSQHRGSRALWPQRVGIRIPWDPRLFIQQQEYDGSRSLTTSLTITGDEKRAQLSSCRDYLDQVWPLTGEAVLQGIIAATEEDDLPLTVTLFDGMQLSLELTDGFLQAQCVGLFDSIVEVIEILAWISCALRESSKPDKITYCTASLGIDQTSIERDSSAEFLIYFTEEDLSPGDFQRL
ncbi:hypothetical protein QBC47DRAFT_426841 [Echria macrotheca]|uniref:Uncharacterized protein n=1 Tax=Echria macrotheca TaxID=438768 RepID=A0AAJ0FGE2_9PEZI|nr:hypothetical protein QBC47DRAFT_426841 [Echria macrotheca]